MSDLCRPASVSVSVSDSLQYGLLGVRWYGNGSHLHSQATGAQLKTRSLNQVRKSQIVYNKMWVSKGAFAVVPPELDGSHATSEYPTFDINTDKLNPSFIEHYMRLEAFQQEAILLCKGSTSRARLNPSDFLSLTVWTPPLHEQRRIAEILSSVDDAIVATRAVIEQSRKVKQGVLGHLLTKGIGHISFKKTEIGEIPEGWDVASIESYLARLIDYRGVPPPKADSGVPLLTAKNVRVGYLNPEPREYISDADFDGWMRRGVPEADDILFTTEAPLGNVAQVPKYKVALGQRTITLCPDRNRLSPAFLKWLLLGPQSQTRIAEKATGSTALGIKQSTFRKMLFPFPPLDEQQRIASYVDEIAAAENSETKKLETIISTKSALMSALLTGRKRVTDDLPMAAE